MYRLGLIDTLVIHAKMMRVGPASLSGAHLGYIPPQLKTNMQRLAEYLQSCLPSTSGVSSFWITSSTLSTTGLTFVIKYWCIFWLVKISSSCVTTLSVLTITSSILSSSTLSTTSISSSSTLSTTSSTLSGTSSTFVTTSSSTFSTLSTTSSTLSATFSTFSTTSSSTSSMLSTTLSTLSATSSTSSTTCSTFFLLLGGTWGALTEISTTSSTLSATSSTVSTTSLTMSSSLSTIGSKMYLPVYIMKLFVYKWIRYYVHCTYIHIEIQSISYESTQKALTGYFE